MSQPSEHETVDDAIRQGIELGILGRWRCEFCGDWVPYYTDLGREVLADVIGTPRKGVTTEVESRAAHHLAYHAEDES